ncbi:hypothetical protein BDV39DRAFT_71788 [Aspergillus sergii]|uniref:Uncharacterized protein n=1 Tax=Aspergillus sergii TaxID=1034303 RepID=A0A5N6X5S4_9EURO|nr:hypothetical protein BDV39DRAFT_71788 [Aspergillus sergii]
MWGDATEIIHGGTLAIDAVNLSMTSYSGNPPWLHWSPAKPPYPKQRNSAGHFSLYIFF